MSNMPPTKFCIYQRDFGSFTDSKVFVCMRTENDNTISSHVCPFDTRTHAQYICRYYTQLPVCKNSSIEERLDKLEQAILKRSDIYDTILYVSTRKV